VWVKDEGVNPTGTFKARALSCGISMALELGVRQVAIASAGNAAGALAAYAARAGLAAHVFIPRDAPESNFLECRAYGARVTLVDGHIEECSRLAAAGRDWFDLSAFMEPYGLEGNKTMGYELVEQFRWEAPDAILVPAGDGVGLAGIWKAFEEMESLDWTAGRRPRMVAVQADGCQPLVRAFERGETRPQPWECAHTVARGLRVSHPIGGALVLNAVRASGGAAVAVSDADLLQAGLDLAAAEGIFAAPEGTACAAALRKLADRGFFQPKDRIVICNTGSGLKYLGPYSTRIPRSAASEQDKLGGLITPR
jgi:threonine synthase